MSKVVKTPKGTELPLSNLKGKDYLMITYRIQWFNEVVPNFSINTEIIKHDKDESIVKAEIFQYDDKGSIVRRVTAHKREDSKGFPDHLEKAETGSVGRALLLLGYGTQFALADLDEGSRLADSPLEIPNKGGSLSFTLDSSNPSIVLNTTTAPPIQVAPSAFIKKPSFRSTKKAAEETTSGDLI